jgi:hypothetical protein
LQRYSPGAAAARTHLKVGALLAISVVQTAILLAIAVIRLHVDPNDARRQVWNGKWPGEEDCERLGFCSNGDPDFPDLNRLFTDCVWDADAQHWERKQ